MLATRTLPTLTLHLCRQLGRVHLQNRQIAEFGVTSSIFRGYSVSMKNNIRVTRRF
jgi:hypothetical protein